MSRRVKKFVLWLIAVAALLANALLFVRGLSKKETDGKGEKTRNLLLASTATASILAILALLMNRRRERDEYQRVLGRCPVCDVELTGLGKYCAACGSRT